MKVVLDCFIIVTQNSSLITFLFKLEFLISVEHLPLAFFLILPLSVLAGY